MNIGLFWPKGFDLEYAFPFPYAYLLANIDRSRHDVKIIDGTIENLDAGSPDMADRISSLDADLACFSCFTPEYPEVVRLARKVKEISPRTVTLLGGMHATAVPEKIFLEESIDYLMRGEAERAFPAILEKLEAAPGEPPAVDGLCHRIEGGGLHIADPVVVDDLDSLPLPDYEAVGFRDYLDRGYRLDAAKKMNAPIRATRGCPYKCHFCAVHRLSGRKLRKHSVDYLVDWTLYLYREMGIRWVNLVDDNFTFDPEYAGEFCRRIIDLGLDDLSFGCPNGIRMERGTPELWRLMKKAGWRSLTIAPETGSERVLKLMKKTVKLDRIPGIARDIREAGLKCKAFFIIGFPGETVDDLRMTKELILKSGFYFVHFNNFQPMPGAPMYNELLDSGEIEDTLVPANFSDGIRTYTPPELEGFNFSKFVLGVYLHMALKQPGIILYLFRQYSFSFMFRKFLLNLKAMMKPGRVDGPGID